MAKIPKTLGACADELYRLRAEIAGFNKKIEALDERRKEIQGHLINNLPKSEARGIAGKQARAEVVTKEIPRVDDWTKFYAHIKKTGDFSLLGRRVGEAAVKEKWEAGKKVPGVVPFTTVSISLTKV